MGRKRLPKDELKDKVTIRVPRWMIAKIKESGTVQQYIETLLNINIKK